MELEKNIIKIRKQNNLTQDDFAEKYFITRQTVSNWENSKSYPDLETLIKISDDFNVSLDVLLKEDDKMVNDISNKQKKYKLINIFTIMLNVVGLICLLYFGIPYILKINSINNYSWKTCGFILIIGLIPLFICNLMAYIFIKLRNKKINTLFFIPSFLCMILVGHYMFMPHQEVNNNQKFHSVMKCSLNEKIYKYIIYKNNDEQYLIKMDEKYKIPSSKIDSTNTQTITDSIEKYLKNKGGMCT